MRSAKVQTKHKTDENNARKRSGAVLLAMDGVDRLLRPEKRAATRVRRHTRQQAIHCHGHSLCSRVRPNPN